MYMTIEKKVLQPICIAAASASASFYFSKCPTRPSSLVIRCLMSAMQNALQARDLARLPSGSASMSSHARNPLLNPFSSLMYPYQLAIAASAAQAAAQAEAIVVVDLV